MPKPRVFIGSSVEGLSVAYPVQQNLLHSAEVTIWDQGIFELSRTTMESLIAALSESDFAIFVFTPDDLIHIRDKTSLAVRDNVLFEFGLFMGKLGRDRVFFIIPSDGQLHLPTDLLGITPGKYDSARTDGKMQAATGPVCHQIQVQITKLGTVSGRISVEESTEGGVMDEKKSGDWIFDFLDKRYDLAKEKLEGEMESLSPDMLLKNKAWILYCEFKARGDGDLGALLNFANVHSECVEVQIDIATILRFEGHVSKAIELLLAAQLRKPNDSGIALALALCHTDATDDASAIAELRRFGSDDFPEVALRLAAVLEGDEKASEALVVIQRCYKKHPDNRDLRFKYARLAQELGLNPVALHLLNRLTLEYPESEDYWGYLGNSCLALELYDKALYAYRQATKFMKEDGSSQWVAANIGNLLIHKGLPSEACEYLERAVKYESTSDYAHDRFATALRKKAAESKDFDKKCIEGKRQVREAELNALANTELSVLSVLPGLPLPILELKTPKV